MTYDWKKFTAKSDKRYSDARQTGNVGSLTPHNILKNGEVELRFIADCVQAHSGQEVRKGFALDVCCGIGHMSDCLASLGFRVRGIDMNCDAIKIAKKTYPNIDFRVADATDPNQEIAGDRYDFILIREAHPFSRVRDDNFQRALLKNYISILKPGGVLAIGHAMRGGSTDIPSISCTAMTQTIEELDASYCGPYFLFAYKHLGIRSRSKFIIKALSQLSNLISRITNNRFIEYFIIIKN